MWKHSYCHPRRWVSWLVCRFLVSFLHSGWFVAVGVWQFLQVEVGFKGGELWPLHFLHVVHCTPLQWKVWYFSTEAHKQEALTCFAEHSALSIFTLDATALESQLQPCNWSGLKSQQSLCSVVNQYLFWFLFVFCLGSNGNNKWISYQKMRLNGDPSIASKNQRPGPPGKRNKIWGRGAAYTTSYWDDTSVVPP